MGLGCVWEIRRPNSNASDVGFLSLLSSMEKWCGQENSVMILDLTKRFVTNNVRHVCRRTSVITVTGIFRNTYLFVLRNVWSIDTVVDCIDDLLGG